MKKTSALLLSALLLSLLFGGCGKRGETPPAPTSPPEAQTLPADQAGGAEEHMEEEPQADPRPAEVRVITRPAEDLDPANIASRGKNCLLEIYEPLFEVRADGSVACVLADGGRGAEGGFEHEKGRYTVYLREGVTDHDGNPLSAADAAFCITRQAGAEGWELFKEATAGEDGSVTVLFSRELSGAGEWERHFASLYLYTEKAYNDHGGLTTEACGTGPYRLESVGEDGSLLLTPFDDYRQGGEREERAAANVQSIRYLFPDSAADRVITLEVGKADMADCLSYADTVDFREGGSYADLFRVEGSWSGVNYLLVPNVQPQGMMNNENLRRGVFYAIDNALLASYAGEGGARACTGLANPDCPDLPGSGESYESVTLPVDEVRSLLRQAQYVNESFVLLTAEGGVEEELAAAIQSMLRPLSINANVVKVPREELEEKLKDQKAWDLAILPVEGRSAAEVWTKLWTDRDKNGSTVGFLRDSRFNELLARLATEDGRTGENLAAVQDYATEHAYAMALVQLYRPVVLPRSCTGCYLTGSGAILPGGCTYE